MKYKELKNYYYKNIDEYAAEYKMRFNSEEAVHLDFMIGSHQAFFLQNSIVLNLAYNIMKLNRQVEDLCDILPGIAKNQYSKKCLIDEIVLSNNIEGIKSSRKEIGEALGILETQSKAKNKHTRFISLVNKYLKLMNKDIISIKTCADIRNLYDEILLEEVIGDDKDNKPDGEIFRKGPENIIDGAGKVIHTGAYPEVKIIEDMEKALEFLNDDSVDFLFRNCIFHYLFEYIHPFYDGNGRLGRFILSYSISHCLEPLLAYRLSWSIKEKINQYYKAFDTCNDSKNLGDLTPFLIMQLTIIYEAIKDLKTSMEQKTTQLHRYVSTVFDQLAVSDEKMQKLYYILIQAALFSEQGIPMEGIKEVMNIKSPKTVNNLLDNIPEDLLVVLNQRPKYYQMNLDALDKILLESKL